MSESPDEKLRWTKALDAEGVSAVRRALERSRAGPPGLIRIGQTWVTQSFAKSWLDQYDAHKISRGRKIFLVAMALAVMTFLVGWAARLALSSSLPLQWWHNLPIWAF
jgi:hypothetical protein